MSKTEIVPEIVVVRIEETSNWNVDFLRENGIVKMFGVYVYDRRKHVHCCELMPSYELHFVEHQYELAPGIEHDDEQLDCLDEEIRLQDTEQVQYYHTRVIDRIEVLDDAPAKMVKCQVVWMTPEDCEEYDLDSDQALEDVLDNLRGNTFY